MSKKPSDRQDKPKDVKQEQNNERQEEKHRESKKKPTVQFEEGQKFTSDEDIKRRTA